MDQHGAYPDALRRKRNATKRIGQQIGAQPLPGMTPIHRQASDNRNRDQIGRIATQARWRCLAFHRTSQNTNIGRNPVALAYDISASVSPFVVLGPLV